MKKVYPIPMWVLLLLVLFSSAARAQYCTPTGGTSSTSYYINNLTTTGGTTNISYTSSAYSAYVNNSGTTFSQLPGASVNVSMGIAGGGTYYYYCWVDWNNDFTFNTTNEQLWATTTYTSSPYTTGVIAVPAGQPAGIYRVRFAVHWLGAIVNCGPAAYGNYVDYSIQVGTLAPCTGMPNAGTATATPSTGSPSSSFTASATGITNAGGMSYQWQQSASATGPWTNVAGATSPSSSITAGAVLNVITYYRLKSTCTNTNDSIFSNVVTFTTSYCTPTGGTSSTSYYLNNITTTGGTSNLAYTASSYSAYVNNSGTTFSQLPGANINVSMGASVSSTYYYRCWVDWNNDGIFNTTNEQIWATTTYTASPYTAGVIAVPAGQTPGTYRVRFAISFSGAIVSCGPAPYGNYVDFSLIVGVLSPCTGMPNAGIATASPTTGSPSSTFNLAATGITNAGGMGYQWQQSASATGPWTNVTGATLPTAAVTATATFGVTTYYRLRSTCTNTNDSIFSNVVSFTTSYCTPTGGASSTSYYINNITTTGGTTNLAYTASSYSAYVNNSASTFSRLPGGNINVSMGISVASTYYYYCWIDWDNNGIFNTTNEQIWATTTYTAPPYAGVIAIPAAQAPGNYRVRFATSFIGAVTSCGPSAYGNYVDYTLVVISPCNPPTGLNVSNLTDVSATLGWTAVTGSLGYEYVVDQTAANPVSGTATTATSFSTSGLTPNTTYYLHLRNNCGTSGYSSWVTLTFKTCIAGSITPLSTTTFCTGSNVVLNGPTPPVGSTYTYQWKLNGTNVGTSSSYTASSSGNYTLIVTNTTGNCVATVTPATVVTVGAPPSSAITPANTAGLCPGGTVALTTNTAPGLGITWYLNGTVIPGATSATYNAPVIGNYTANVSSGPGCNSTTATPTAVSMLTPPPAVISPLAHPVICQSTTTLLTANSGTNYSYQWYFNGTAITTAGTSMTYAAANAGVYTVKVTNNTISCGATSTGTSLVVVPLPPATTSPAAPSSGCDSLVLTANAGPGYTYKWKLANNFIIGASSQVYPATTTGVYAAVVTDTNGCIGTSANVNITINPSPAAVITYGSPIAFCHGGAVALTSYVSNGLKYQWMSNGTIIPDDTTNTYVAYQPASYTLKVTNSFGCTKISPPILVQVYPLPTPVITRNASNLLSTGNYIGYQWYMDNQPVPGATLQSYQTIGNGGYSVEVKDSNGCYSRSPVQFINNTGVKTIASSGIRIYPNPTHDVIYIDAPMSVNITVRDLQGRNIIVAPDAKKIDLSSIADGVYMLIVTNSEGRFIGSERLVKTK